ncbi:hypothetical protein EVAR_35593_1, partial [Eumeta japonica]
RAGAGAPPPDHFQNVIVMTIMESHRGARDERRRSNACEAISFDRRFGPRRLPPRNAFALSPPV